MTGYGQRLSFCSHYGDDACDSGQGQIGTFAFASAVDGVTVARIYPPPIPSSAARSKSVELLPVLGPCAEGCSRIEHEPCNLDIDTHN